MKEKTISGLKLDFVAVMFLFGLGALVTVLLAENYGIKPLWGGMLMSVPAALYLGLRRPKPIRKILLASLIFGLSFGFFFEFIQEFNRSYSVINTVLPSIGPMPLDNIVAHFCMALLMFMFYEHFIVVKTNNNISSRYKFALFGSIVANILVLIAYAANLSVLNIDYSYLVFGLIAIMPLLMLAWARPKHLKDLVLIAPTFFVIYFILEIVAVNYSWWVYPNDQYIGYVELFENIRYPIEELLFWMLLYAPALLSYYKIFIDKPKSNK